MQHARKGRPPKYPWKAWTNGGEWEIVYGTEFDCTPESMAVLIRRHAKMVARVPVIVSVSGDTVYFQFQIQAQEEARVG